MLVFAHDVAGTNQALFEHAVEGGDHVALLHRLDDAIAADAVGPEGEAEQAERGGGDPERFAFEQPPFADQPSQGIDLSVLDQRERSAHRSGGDAGEAFAAQTGVGVFESPEDPAADHAAIGGSQRGAADAALAAYGAESGVGGQQAFAGAFVGGPDGPIAAADGLDQGAPARPAAIRPGD